MNLSPGTFVLTQEESVVKAEILQALQYIECNHLLVLKRIQRDLKQCFLTLIYAKTTDKVKQKLDRIYSLVLLGILKIYL